MLRYLKSRGLERRSCGGLDIEEKWEEIQGIGNRERRIGPSWEESEIWKP